MTEIYLYFYQATLQTFVHFKQFLQREDPIISLVDQQIQSFLTKLAGKFLTIHTIKVAKSDLTKLKFDTSVQLPDGSIFVGMTTKTQLTKLFAEGDITHGQYSNFFKGVRGIAHFRVLTFLETGPEFGRESEASCEVRLAGAKIKRDR